MSNIKSLSFPLLLLLGLFCMSLACSGADKEPEEKIIVAYVTSWSDVIPDPSDFTHLNYAFGHVNESFDGIKIDNVERFKNMIKLKEKNPDLKVLLSIGGWGSGRFSEMAASDSLRKSFAKNCGQLIEEYKFDGIDIDWEYPTIGWAGISSDPEDTKNFTLLMADIREAISEDKLLTLASSATARYVDFNAVVPVVDFVNLMTYDMSDGMEHHSPLFSSSITPEMTSDKSVRLHREAGVPDEKIVLGIPFFGRGNHNKETYYKEYKDITLQPGQQEKWDSISKSPYIVDADGNYVIGFDNPRSVEIKCEYILDNNLKGAMFWDYNGDDSTKSLSKTIKKVLKGQKNF